MTYFEYEEKAATTACYNEKVGYVLGQVPPIETGYHSDIQGEGI